MSAKDTMSLSEEATMQFLALCPFFVVILDESKLSKVNIVTISYVGILSENPPIVGLAIRPKRYSHNLILKTGEFTLNLPSLDMLENLDYCGTFSGRDYDKATERNIELEKSEVIKTPGMRISPITLECKLRQTMFLSREGASHDYFIADVVAFRKKTGYVIENEQIIITTNYDYHSVGDKLGKAFKVWKKDRR
jgi:flavin reductase (DIM6/NTAB) family NADH-FMN oxidoreductase RutF